MPATLPEKSWNIPKCLPANIWRICATLKQWVIFLAMLPAILPKRLKKILLSRPAYYWNNLISFLKSLKYHLSTFYQDKTLIFFKLKLIFKFLKFSWRKKFFTPKKVCRRIAGNMPAILPAKIYKNVCRQYAGKLWKKKFGKKFQKIKKYFWVCILFAWNFFWQKVEIICYIWARYLISNMHVATGIEPKIWRFSYFKRGCK